VQRIAAQHFDVFLTWGEPPEQAAERLTTMRRLVATHGRQLRSGIHLHVIVRETRYAWSVLRLSLRTLTGLVALL
jgi:alkanesulfonate monooxygenase